MANETVKSKRKSISKKLRFEVFKRDSFTCQYCGRKAPDVVLHVDHIKPTSKGGKNSLMNLVTSCVECNLGKGASVLQENSVLEKSRKQAEFLQARREQIEMMRDWHIEMVNEKDQSIQAVNDLYTRLTNGQYCISEQYKNKTISGLISKYGLGFVMDALRAGADSYNDPSKALDNLPGICACRANPELNKRVHILNKMNKKFWNFKRYEASEILQRGQRVGGSKYLQEVDELISTISGAWYQVKLNFIRLTEDWER